MGKRLLFYIGWLLLFVFFETAGAQPSDITLITGHITPLYTLENALSGKVAAAGDEALTLVIDNIAVDDSQILVRFYIVGLSEDWLQKPLDANRLYGSYLPVAEITLDSGTVLTPSSLSRYSLLSSGGTAVAAGLLHFITTDAPESFLIGFNQIPFDTEPLDEGLSTRIELQKNENTAASEPEKKPDSVLEFSICSTAQTESYTMLQPCVRMTRDNETLSKFGWIIIQDADTRKIQAASRSSLFGFNLTDDAAYSPAHAYTFAAQTEEKPLRIHMDSAYIQRSFSESPTVNISLGAGFEKTDIRLDEETTLTITGYQAYPEEEFLRLYLSSSDLILSDCSFTFPDYSSAMKPTVYCGLEGVDGQFACDIYTNEIGMPDDSLRLRIDAVEYYQEGPWETEWTATAISASNSAASRVSETLWDNFGNRFLAAEGNKIPEDLEETIRALTATCQKMTEADGWVVERIHTHFETDENKNAELVPYAQKDQYLTDFITESYYHLDHQKITEEVTLIRVPETGKIVSAVRQAEGVTTDLIHGLAGESGKLTDSSYFSNRDFITLAQSFVPHTEPEPCEYTGETESCITFEQSLTGVPGAAGSQKIRFILDMDSGLVLQTQIDYDGGAMFVEKNVERFQQITDLPEDIRALIEAIETL